MKAATEKEMHRGECNKISLKDKATIAKYVNSKHCVAKAVRHFEDKSVGTENLHSLSATIRTL